MKARLFVYLFFCACLAHGGQADTSFEELSQRAAAALHSDPAEAAKLYQQAVALRPSWAEGWFYLGASLYQVKRYQEGQKAFERAGELAPENGTVWAFLGLCDFQLGRDDEALANISKGERLALADNKEFVSSVRNHAAVICLRRQNFGAAMQQLQPLAKIGDESAETIENLGIAALGLPYAPPAVPADKKPLIELAGRAAWALAAQRVEQAPPLFQQLLQKYPAAPGVHYLYGLYLMESNSVAALAEFRKELEIRPKHVPARIQAAILEIQSGSPADAAKLAQQAINLQPSNVYCDVVLGRAYLNMGQVDKAIPVLEAAVKLAPEDPQPHLYLGQAYSRSGKTIEAKQEQATFERLRSAQDPLFVPHPDIPSAPPQ